MITEYLCPECGADRDHPGAYCGACGYDPSPAVDVDPPGANPPAFVWRADRLGVLRLVEAPVVDDEAAPAGWIALVGMAALALVFACGCAGMFLPAQDVDRAINHALWGR